MKAEIRISIAKRKFTQDQISAIRRFSIILQEHNMSVLVVYKKKTKKRKDIPLKLKVI